MFYAEVVPHDILEVWKIHFHSKIHFTIQEKYDILNTALKVTLFSSGFTESLCDNRAEHFVAFR